MSSSMIRLIDWTNFLSPFHPWIYQSQPIPSMIWSKQVDSKSHRTKPRFQWLEKWVPNQEDTTGENIFFQRAFSEKEEDDQQKKPISISFTKFNKIGEGWEHRFFLMSDMKRLNNRWNSSPSVPPPATCKGSSLHLQRARPQIPHAEPPLFSWQHATPSFGKSLMLQWRG